MTTRALWLGIYALFAISTARGAPPQLRAVVPSAVRPGETVEVELHGEGLKDAHALWSDLPITAERIDGSDDGKRARFRIAAPADAPVAIGGLRAVTPEGVSNLRLLMIDDLPTVAEADDHRERERAQELSGPLAVDGSTDGNAFDWFRISAQTGRRVSVEVLAQRLGSQLDPVLRVVDAEGRELAFSDDEPGTGSDCRLALVPETDGPLFIELRDVTYRGGFEMRYRLRIGDFPFVTSSFPLAARGPGSARIELVGPDADGLPPAEVEVGETQGTCLPVAARFGEGQGSGFTSLLTSDLDEAVETEPNDTIESADLLSLPGAVNGRFHAPRDRDHFRFEVAAGERWTFRGVTRSAGSPTDLWLSLRKLDGTSLADVEDTGSEEGIVDRTFAEAGSYVLLVEDLHRRGGPEHAYRLECRRFRPGFDLEMEREWHNAPRGGVFTAKVLCSRRGWDGTIELSVVGEGFERLGGEIPKGKNDGVVRVRVPSSLEPGAAVDISIVGRARIGEEEFEARAGTLSALHKELPRTPFPPRALDGLVTIGVGAPFPAFIALEEIAAPIVVPRGVEGSPLRVVARRLDGGFKDPIALRFEGLPEGLGIEGAGIEKDRADAMLKARASAECALGDHRVRIVAEGVFRDQPGSATLDGVVLRVIEPLRVSASASVDVAPGGKGKARLEVTRLGGLAGAARVEWLELPAGLEAGPIEIAADARAAELEIGAKADATLGSYHEARLAVTLQVEGRTIRVEAPPILVRIVAP